MTDPVARHPRAARRIAIVACVLNWVGAFILTHLPPARLPNFHLNDKAEHGIGFLALASLFWLTLAAYGVRPVWRVRLVMLVMAAYAAFDEITQPLTGRTCDIDDWLADVIASILAVATWELIAAWVQKRRRA